MMADIVLSFSPSVNAAYKKNKSSLGACQTAVLNKLNRVESQVSQALVRYSYAEARAIENHLRTGDASYIAGYRTKILDGNHLSGTEHRIEAIRAERAAALPGKSLVVLDPRLRLIQDYFPIEDGHAQERSALDEVIKTIESKDLWVADRNFCTLKFITALDKEKAGFVIRYHSLLGGKLSKRRKIGETETGVVYECTMKLSLPDGKQLKLRRIEVELFKPTRDKETVVVLLTNVDVNDADALRIADIYLKRWKIETAFQVLTTTLRCEINTLGYPQCGDCS
jgi:IS4 transposase